MQICPGLHTVYKTFWARFVLSIGFLLCRTLVRLALIQQQRKCPSHFSNKTGSETPAFSNVLQYKCGDVRGDATCNT